MQFPFYQKAPRLLHDPSAFERHYHPDQPSRYVNGFVKRCERLHRKGRVLYVDASGGGLLQMLGVGDWDTLRSACVALMKRPQVVEDLVHRTADFYCVCLDDRPRSNIPFGHYRLYRRLLEEIAQRG